MGDFTAVWVAATLLSPLNLAIGVTLASWKIGALASVVLAAFGLDVDVHRTLTHRFHRRLTLSP